MDTELFKDVVGQYEAKKKLGFFLDAYKSVRQIPNMLLVAPKGNGKTFLANQIAKGLYEYDDDGQPVMVPSKVNPDEMKHKRKTFITINCASLKNVKNFFQDVIAQHVSDRNVTLFLDECSELSRDIVFALLTILNPSISNRTTYSFQDFVFNFDFKKQSFLFATSEPNKVYAPLADRLESIQLEEYTYSNLATILRRGTLGVEYEDGVDEEIATTLRGSARSAQLMATKVLSYLRGSKVFMAEDWNALKEVLSIKPLGLTAIEINALRSLAAHSGGSTLTALSARTGMSRASLQHGIETYLLKHDLISIEAIVGRRITRKGLDILASLSV